MSMQFSSASGVGSRRYQEDRFVVQEFPSGLLAAVMDGHGGFTCAEKVRTLIPMYWLALDTEEYLSNPELRLKKFVDSLVVNTEHFTNGCTLSVVFIPKDTNTAYIAILGDSPVILNSEGSITVSPEHNVRTNMAERIAAQERGAIYENGYIFGDYYGEGLQMSRVLGDKPLRKILSRIPEILVLNMVPECYIIVATDGLIDPAHKSTDESILDHIIKIIDSGGAAQELVDDALSRETGDNVTAIVIRLLKD